MLAYYILWCLFGNMTIRSGRPFTSIMQIIWKGFEVEDARRHEKLLVRDVISFGEVD